MKRMCSFPPTSRRCSAFLLNAGTISARKNLESEVGRSNELPDGCERVFLLRPLAGTWLLRWRWWCNEVGLFCLRRTGCQALSPVLEYIPSCEEFVTYNFSHFWSKIGEMKWSLTWFNVIVFSKSSVFALSRATSSLSETPALQYLLWLCSIVSPSGFFSVSKGWKFASLTSRMSFSCGLSVNSAVFSLISC